MRTSYLNRGLTACLAITLAGVFVGGLKAAVMAPISDPYSNSNLYLVGGTSTTSGTWLSAEAQAEALGGHLVTIHSPAENQFIDNTFFKNLTSQGGPDLSNAYALWMGLYDPTGAKTDDGTGATHAANFVWSDGETSTYRNWDVNEPNNGNGGGTHEYYGSLWGPDAQTIVEGGVPTPLGSWNDQPNLYPGPAVPSQGYYGIASVPVPEPTTGTACVLGVVLIGQRRRRAIAA